MSETQGVEWPRSDIKLASLVAEALDLQPTNRVCELDIDWRYERPVQITVTHISTDMDKPHHPWTKLATKKLVGLRPMNSDPHTDLDLFFLLAEALGVQTGRVHALNIRFSAEGPTYVSVVHELGAADLSKGAQIQEAAKKLELRPVEASAPEPASVPE